MAERKSEEEDNSVIILQNPLKKVSNSDSPSDYRSIILFIQECGFILEARELTVATACMLFHRYRDTPSGSLTIGGKTERRLSGSSSENHAALEQAASCDHMVATTCLLLAGKIEENHLNIRKLINVAYKSFFREKELTDIDEYYAMRSSVLTLELWLLRLVGFHPAFDHPHQYLVCFLKACQDWLPRDQMKLSPVAGIAWSLLRDSYLSDVLWKEAPEHLAVACVAAALQLSKIAFPEPEAGHRTWIKACCADLSSEDLERIVGHLTHFYR